MKIQTLQKPLVQQGWLRALIYFICISLIMFFFTILDSYLISQAKAGTEKGAESIGQLTLLYFFMTLVIVLLTWFFRKKVDKRSFKSLGFAWKDYNNEAGLGFFTALSMLGMGSLILVAAGFLSFTGGDFQIGPLFIELVLMVVVAFVEELLFRGYLLNNLMLSMNKWLALIITAALFALFHGSNSDVTVLAIVNIFFAGLLLGLNYIFTQNLWFSVLFHFGWNYFQGPVLGYDVSGLKLTTVLQQSATGSPLWTGGSFGFEGSLLCPFLFIAALIIFYFAFARRYGPVRG